MSDDCGGMTQDRGGEGLGGEDGGGDGGDGDSRGQGVVGRWMRGHHREQCRI